MSEWLVQLLLFFFSSRRRHTRLVSDWSSDVCSSDLVARTAWHTPPMPSVTQIVWPCGWVCQAVRATGVKWTAAAPIRKSFDGAVIVSRSEERRVGKECGSRGAALG